MRKQKGFSLIELLIVVAIILIIAAIAIPNLLKAKMAANESSAASQLRTFDTAEVSYLNACGGYAADEGKLGPASPETCDTGMGYLDNTVGAKGPLSKGGYQFTYTTGGTEATITGGASSAFSEYVYSAEPLGWGSTGKNGFCTTPDNVVHKVDGSSAAPTMPGSMTACQALPTI
jgi:prepilin-type N-terminal cleavage/methylation domain-containing protein